MKPMNMNSLRCLAQLIFAAGILVTSAHAQEMPKQGTAPKPAPSASEAVLEQWNDIGRKLMAMAEDFPDDKYDFKPAPAVGTFAQRLIHAAHANEFFINALLGQKMPEMADPKREQFKSKSDVVAFVKKSFADGAAAIKAKGDKGMSDLVVDPFENEQTRISDFPMASSSIQERSTASLRFITVWQAWCRPSRARRSSVSLN